MEIYNKFINWLDLKLKINRIVSFFIGSIIILGGFYFTRNIQTHTVNSTIIDWIIFTICVIVGSLFLTLAKFGRSWGSK